MKPVIAEISAGAIVYRKKDGEFEFLLLQNKGENWEFPIGHMKKGEELYSCAKREVMEETGLTGFELDINFHHYFTIKKEYLADISFKTIHLFLVEAKEEVTISSEHLDYKWVNQEEAIAMLKKKHKIKSLQKAIEYLKS